MTPSPEFPHPVEQEFESDWRKGRNFLLDSNKNNKLLSYSWSHPRLESKPEEDVKWQQALFRVKTQADQNEQQDIKYGATLAWLNDPDISYLIALWVKKQIDIETRENVFNWEGPIPYWDDAMRVKKRNQDIVNTQIADQVLSGKEISMDDFKPDKFEGFSESQSNTLSIIWQSFIQHTLGPKPDMALYRFLPYTIINPQSEETRQSISEFMEESFKQGGTYSFSEQIQQKVVDKSPS